MVSQSDITYRLRGIPGHYEKDEVSQLLAQLLGLDVGAIWVRSLASHPFRGMEKVATLNLWERLGKLEDGANEWKFQFRDPLQGDVLDIVIDTNFIGITPLHGIPDEECDTCCIALSGLNAHAFGSFKARSDNFMWLRDALPNDLPNSRIYIYGYDTSIIDSLSRQTVLDLGLHFAENLKGLIGRWSSMTCLKSLLLIGHSLGGLVLEQALTNLMKNERENMEIMRALKGILLFGVPHLGMLNSPLLPMVQGQPNEGLISCLKVDSDFLELQQEDFATVRSKMRNVQVVSFYETVETPTVEKDRQSQRWKMIGSPALLVSKLSATKGCDVIIPINRNHSEIVKFSRQHNDYFVVVNRLRELGKPYQQNQAPHYSNFSDEEQTALHSLGFSEQHWRRDEIDPANHTCGWLLSNSTFNTWLNPQDQKERILWIAGNPGTGKSTMMKYVHNVIEQQWHVDYVLFSYFFHGRGTTLQSTKLGFLRSILHQLLRRFQNLLPIFMSKYDEKDKPKKEEKDIQWTEVELKTILIKVICELQLYERVQICLLVDALDESGEQTALDIVSLLGKIATDCSKIKVVFSCRWYPIVQGNCNFIAMEKENQADIQTVVNSLLLEEFQNDKEITILKEAILRRAGGMFQWALLVTQSIVDRHRKLGNPVPALLKIIGKLPSDLHELYASLLQNLEREEKHQTIKLLRWLLFSIRPLTAEELQHALVTDEKDMPSSIYDFESNDHFVDPIKGIITLSRGLAEIRHHEEKRIAQFIHQSVSEYLLMGGGFGQLIGFTNRKSVVGESHFALSRSCINYALLPEISEFASVNIDKYESYKSRPFFNYGNETQTPIGNSAERFPLAQYVHDYWVVHIMHAESHNVDQKDLLELLKNREKEMSPFGVLTIPPNRSFYGSMYKSMWDVFNEDDARFKNIWGFDANEQQGEYSKFPLGLERPWEAWNSTKDDMQVGYDLMNAWRDDEACANIVNLLSLAGIRSALKSIGQQALSKMPQHCGPQRAEKTRKSPLLLSLMGDPKLRLEDIPEYLTTEEVNVDLSELHTPVFLAVLLEREDLVQCFINAGAELNRLCGSPYTLQCSALWMAISYKNEKIARMLRDAGAKIYGEIEWELWEPDWDMASYKMLLDVGVTAEEIFAPVSHDSFDAEDWFFISELLEAGLDPNAVIKNDLTVFQAALRSDHLDLIADFVECPRTELDLVDAHGRTPLMRRVMWKSTNSPSDLQRTIEYCAYSGRFDLAARDHFGETLLVHAIRGTRSSIVKTLLNTGVDPNALDLNGRTPLMVAAEHGRKKVLRDLLASSRTDVNLSDNRQWTALCYATANRKTVCANMLFMSSRIDVEDSRRRLASAWFDCVAHGYEGFLRGFADLRPQWFYCEVLDQMRFQALHSGKTHVIFALADIGFNRSIGLRY